MKRIAIAVVTLALSFVACQPAEAGPLRNGARALGRGVGVVGRFIKSHWPRPLARLLRGCG